LNFDLWIAGEVRGRRWVACGRQTYMNAQHMLSQNYAGRYRRFIDEDWQ